MERVVRSRGYGENSFRPRLAIPRASRKLIVCGLSVDVFILPGAVHG